MAPSIVPAGYQNELIDFRKWLIEENNDPELTPEVQEQLKAIAKKIGKAVLMNLFLL